MGDNEAQGRKELPEVRAKDKSEVEELKRMINSPEIDKVCVHMWSNKMELTVIVFLSVLVGWFLRVLF